VHGALAACFNCVTGPGLRAWGWLRFRTGTDGCLNQLEPAYPMGIAVGDCQNGFDRIDPIDPVQVRRLGRICVGEGGHDACDRVVPVEAATWGAIKASFE
jgi:hypothetical protein